jgi:hypothetical protein
MTTPVDAMTLLNRLMAIVEANVNPPDINYRGDATAYRQTHSALEEALRARKIPFPFPWTTLDESAPRT